MENTEYLIKITKNGDSCSFILSDTRVTKGVTWYPYKEFEDYYTKVLMDQITCFGVIDESPKKSTIIFSSDFIKGSYLIVKKLEKIRL
jgi:hypothetical protein